MNCQRYSLVRIPKSFRKPHQRSSKKPAPLTKGWLSFKTSFLTQTSKLFAGLVKAKKKKKFLEA